MRTMKVLRLIFGDDLEAGSPGDTIILDGPEERSGRIGFTLYGADGNVKRCGVTAMLIETDPHAPMDRCETCEYGQTMSGRINELAERVLAAVDKDGDEAKVKP